MATVSEIAASGVRHRTPRFGSGDHSAPIRRRSALVYLLLAAAGLLPSLVGTAPWLEALGLGMVFPGAGFFVIGGWGVAIFLLVAVLMLAACALWQLMANMFAPLAVWIGSAGLAAVVASEQAAPWAPYAAAAVAVLFLAFCAVVEKRTVAAEKRRLVEREAYLPAALAALENQAVDAPAPGEREMDADQIAALRYALDRGLQPVEDFAGFDVIEQFQTSAVRYQINWLLWSLQVAQCHYTPSFHGYLSGAQRNLIDKLAQPLSWKWWRWESLLGNFSLSVDPIARDNIMFGGFSSTYIANYTANTGDLHYAKEGALTFRWNHTKVFSHDISTILRAGRANHAQAVYGPLYPCEPNLTYSACNLWGNFAHLTADRIYGTEYSRELLPALRKLHTSEMLGLDGSPHAGRVDPLGIRLPVYTCNFVAAFWGWMANSFFPDLSRRTWAVLRKECVSWDPNGEIRLATLAYDRVDTGNYKKSEAGVYAYFLAFAREMGDEEVAQAIERRLDRDFGRVDRNGTTSYDQASTVNNAVIAVGRLQRRDDIRNLTLKGPPPSCLAGPVLETLDYPQVLVAKAFSNGTDLELVLYPGSGQGERALRIGRLDAGRPYRVRQTGETLVADEDGRIVLGVHLSGRTPVTLEAA